LRAGIGAYRLIAWVEVNNRAEHTSLLRPGIGYSHKKCYRIGIQNRVGSLHHPQTLDYAGKACQGQTLILLQKSVNYGQKSFITLAQEFIVINSVS
jgi:hypothetical protein